MNQIIEFYKKDRGPTGNFAKGTSVKEHSAEIIAVLESATQPQVNEFLAWTEKLPPSPDEVQREKDAEEVRKRLEYEAVQNQLPNDKYSG